MTSHSRPILHSRQETFSQLPNEEVNHSKALPDKLDTQTVVELIKNADLFDLINISLNAKYLKTEQVEQFIQRSLQKGQHNNSTNRLKTNVIDPRQLELIFTPPSKLCNKQLSTESCSPSRVEMSNDENFNIVIDQSFKHSAGRQQFREWLNQQQPLQPSMLENSMAPLQCEAALKSIKYSLQNQITNSKQQMFEDLQKQLQNKMQLDESQDGGNQQPRHEVPRPYNDQVTSTDTKQYHHFHNQSFSDQDFVQESNQTQYQQEQSRIRNTHEMPFKGDFSFHATQLNESYLKKSAVSSSYSTLQDGTQASSQKHRQSPESEASTKNYEATHFLAHHQENTIVQLVPRSLNNLRGNYQQNNQLQLNRSTSNNRILKSAERSRNLVLNTTQSTKNLQQRSFIQSTKSQEGLSKTPRGQLSKYLGNVAQRQDDKQCDQKERQSSIIKSFNETKRFVDPKKQQILNTLQLMNVKCLIELERIKKPSQLVYITARLLCQFFAIFRDSMANGSRQLHMEDLIEWSEIQKHINVQIIKQMNELLGNIRNKILNHETLPVQAKDQIIFKLIQLRQEYFTGENLKIFKHLNTNKSMQAIITFIYNVMKYYLETQLQEQEQQELPQMNQTDGFRSFLASERKDVLNDSSRIEITSIQRQSRNEYAMNTPKSKEKEKSLQKSASRCLLQRRDLSALTSRNQPNTYQSIKAPQILTTQQCITPRLGQTINLQEPGSIQRQPLISRHKSKSPMVRSQARRNEEVSQSITSEMMRQRMKQQSRSKINPTSTSITDSQSFTQEKPLDLNYQLMIESSGFNETIKRTAAEIEQNMNTTPQRKQIDMSIIEQLKQRRKDQKMMRDSSNDKIGERAQEL